MKESIENHVQGIGTPYSKSELFHKVVEERNQRGSTPIGIAYLQSIGIGAGTAGAFGVLATHSVEGLMKGGLIGGGFSVLYAGAIMVSHVKGMMEYHQRERIKTLGGHDE